MRSPDPDYEEKRQYAAERLEEARTDPDVALLYLDECGCEKIPSLDRGYEAKGEKQPTAAPSQSSNQQMRVAACLNATTGTVHARRAKETGRSVLIDLYQEVADCYPEARIIYVVLWQLAGSLPRRHYRKTRAPAVALAPQGAGQLAGHPLRSDNRRPAADSGSGTAYAGTLAQSDREAMALSETGGDSPAPGRRLRLASRPRRCLSGSVRGRIRASAPVCRTVTKLNNQRPSGTRPAIFVWG